MRLCSSIPNGGTCRFLLCLILAVSASKPASGGSQSPMLVAESGASENDPRGVLGKPFTIESAILLETRRIYLTLPPSYEKSAPGRRYPVTVVLDGEALPEPVIAANGHLARMGQIPEALIVGIENTDRLRDLTPPGISVSGSGRNEGGDRFLDFIEQELLPAVDQQFRGSEPRTLIGHSSGGILATYAAATRSTFRAVVAIDTPIWLEDYWLAKQLIARGKEPGYALRYATLEARLGWTDDTWAELQAAAPPSWKLHREHLDQESHESMGLLGAYLGLRAVFTDYSMLAAPIAPTTSILPYYETVASSLGSPVVPPRKLIRNVIEDLSMEGRGAAARSAYDILVAAYGPPPDAREMEASIAEVEKRPPPTETVESLLATPFPTPEEMAGYLGEWRGDVWMNEEELRNDSETLILEVVDGRVTGKVLSHPAPDIELVMPVTYLQVTERGLTYGYMNGMRPRGMLLFEGTLVGDTLSGLNRFGGVNVIRPDGSPRPPVHFALTRQRD